MNMEQSGAHRSLIARTAFLCAPYFVVLTACAMAASDNIASAAAVLRRLASGDEATLRAALAYMGAHALPAPSSGGGAYRNAFALR